MCTGERKKAAVPIRWCRGIVKRCNVVFERKAESDLSYDPDKQVSLDTRPAKEGTAVEYGAECSDKELSVVDIVWKLLYIAGASK